jgi:hypothetical protein
MMNTAGFLCGFIGTGAVFERQRIHHGERRRLESSASSGRHVRLLLEWGVVHWGAEVSDFRPSAIIARSASVLRMTICVRPSSIQPSRRQSAGVD